MHACYKITRKISYVTKAEIAKRGARSIDQNIEKLVWRKIRGTSLPSLAAKVSMRFFPLNFHNESSMRTDPFSASLYPR